MTPLERLTRHISIAETGCWIFTGNRNVQGYGRLSVGGRPRTVHRLMYEIARGPIPAGMFVCHACDTPACFRPDHLWLGTNRENTQDSVRKGRHRTAGAWRAEKDHCIHGHEYNSSETRRTPDGYRQCRACVRAHNERRRLKYHLERAVEHGA